MTIYILKCSRSAFFHPPFSSCHFFEVTCPQPAFEEGAGAPCLCQEISPRLQKQQWATTVSRLRPVMLKSTDHPRDLTVFWFVSPFLPRFKKHFRIDGFPCCLQQLDLLSCTLKASETVSQVHVLNCFSVGSGNAELTLFDATFAAGSNFASPLWAPILNPPGQSQGIEMFPSCPWSPKQAVPRCAFLYYLAECKSPLLKTMAGNRMWIKELDSYF